MQEKLSVIMNFLRQLSPVKLAVSAVIGLAFLLLTIIYLYKISSPNMYVLYSDLTTEDSTKIITELDSQHVPYELAGGGAVVKVPEHDVSRMRIAMAQQGLPSHGSMIGYEIFDKDETLGTTNFLQNVKMVRALEGELTRTITSFDPISKARIHLVIPQREVFSKDKQEPRASVILKLKNQKSLGKNEINAISHLVATAVPGLDIKNITIVDTTGRSLKLGGEDENNMNPATGNSTVEDLRVNQENKLKNVIEQLLERSLGVGKVRAQVSVEMNFDRIVTNAEIYDPDSAVVRSVQSIEERERTPIAGEDSLDISMGNNLPGGMNSESAQGGNAATVERTDETKNYEISKTIRNEISEAGTIQKLSVAVLVDGNYKPDPSTGEMNYTPRTPEELSQIEHLVKAAVGFKEERKDQIKVVNMPFMSDFQSLDSEENWLKDQLPGLMHSMVLVVGVVLVFLTIIRPLAIRLFDAAKSSTQDYSVSKDMFGSEASSEEIEISLSEQRVQIASVKKVNDVMNTHPDESLMVLRKWLNNNG